MVTPDRQLMEMAEQMMEGANLEYHQAIKEMALGNYAKARKNLRVARKAVTDAMDILNKVDSTVGSAIIGYFVPTLRSWIILFGTLIPIVGPFIFLKDLIEKLLVWINDLIAKLRTGELSPSQFNLYRINILQECKHFLNVIDKFDAKIDEAKAHGISEQTDNGGVIEMNKDRVTFTLEDAMNYISDYLSEAVDNAVSVEEPETEKAGPELEGVTLKDNMDYIENYLKEANETEETRVGGDRNSSMKGTYGFIGSAEHYKANSDSRHPQLKTAPWDTELAANLRGNAAMASKTLATPDPFGGAKAVSEQVDTLRLSVYEAFDNGIIDEKTKSTFLEYLDLSNYE